MSEVGRFFSARPFDYHGWEGPSTWSTGYRCQDCGSIPLCPCPECSRKLHESCPKCGWMPSEENDNDEGDEGDADGELEDRWRGDMRDMYNMHRGWLRCQDCGGLPDFDKQRCKECEGDNFRDGILSISIDDTMAFMLPQGYSHESIDAMHRAHNDDADSDVLSHRDDELSESDVPDLVSSADSDDRPFG